MTIKWLAATAVCITVAFPAVAQEKPAMKDGKPAAAAKKAPAKKDATMKTEKKAKAEKPMAAKMDKKDDHGHGKMKVKMVKPIK